MGFASHGVVQLVRWRTLSTACKSLRLKRTFRRVFETARVPDETRAQKRTARPGPVCDSTPEVMVRERAFARTPDNQANPQYRLGRRSASSPIFSASRYEDVSAD